MELVDRIDRSAVTIVAWILTDRWAVVASDRRVTRWIRGKVISADDMSMKTFILNGQLLMAYTGVAEFAGVPTERWVANVLNGVAPNDIPLALREALRIAYAATPQLTGFPHHFRGLGFAYDQGHVPTRFPIGFEVGNCNWITTADRVQVGTTQPEFSSRWNKFGNHKVLVGAVGAPYSLRGLRELERTIKQQVRADPDDPSGSFEAIARFCFRVADENPVTVGRNLLISSLPKSATPAGLEINVPLTVDGIASASQSGPMALMVDDRGSDPVVYFPVMIWPHIQALGGSFGPAGATPNLIAPKAAG